METLHQPSLLNSDCWLLATTLQTHCREIPEAGFQDGLVLLTTKGLGFPIYTSIESPVVDR